METYIIILTLPFTMDIFTKILTILLLITVCSADFMRILQEAKPADGQGSQGKGPNGQGSQGNSTDGQGSQGKGPNGQGSQGKGPNGQGPPGQD